MGKAKIHVDLEAGDKIREMLAGALTLGDGRPAHPVLDGEVVDDDDDNLPPDQPEKSRQRPRTGRVANPLPGLADDTPPKYMRDADDT